MPDGADCAGWRGCAKIMASGCRTPSSSASWIPRNGSCSERVLLSEADPAQDSLRFYFLGTEWRRRVEHVGAKASYDPEGPLIL